MGHKAGECRVNMNNVEEERKGDAKKATWTAAVAFVGLAIHGFVPLHEDVR